LAAALWLALLGGFAISAQDAGQSKYTVKVPGGLAFSEFEGYEAWQTISISRNDRVVAAILGNPVMIDAYRAGIPGNGKPVPDGAKMAKVHWKPKQNQFFQDATAELQWWYQFYFATERGRAGYEAHRHDFARLIWQIASPKWKFDDATFDRTAASLDNPDHVSIVIHNYRWRLGLAGGSRPMTASRIGSRPLRSSPCPPSRSKATPTARRIRLQPHMLPSSRACTCTGT
jgi:hypothetical protein